MCCRGCLRGAISHTQPLSYGNTINLPFPNPHLIHFATTETALMTFVVGDNTTALTKPTGLQQNLHQVTKAQRGSRDTATLSLTPVLDGCGLLAPRPGRFTPGKETRYPWYTKLCESQGRSGRVRKTSPPQGFDLQTVQSAASATMTELSRVLVVSNQIFSRVLNVYHQNM